MPETPKGNLPNLLKLQTGKKPEMVPAVDVLVGTPTTFHSSEATHRYGDSSGTRSANVSPDNRLHGYLFITTIVAACGCIGYYENTEIITSQCLQLEVLQRSIKGLTATSKWKDANFTALRVDIQTCGLDHIDLNRHCRKQIDKNTEVIRGLKVNLKNCRNDVLDTIARNMNFTYKTKDCPGPEAYAYAAAGIPNEHTGCNDIAATIVDTATKMYCKVFGVSKPMCKSNYYANNKQDKFRANARQGAQCGGSTVTETNGVKVNNAGTSFSFINIQAQSNRL